MFVARASKGPGPAPHMRGDTAPGSPRACAALFRACAGPAGAGTMHALCAHVVMGLLFWRGLCGMVTGGDGTVGWILKAIMQDLAPAVQVRMACSSAFSKSAFLWGLHKGVAMDMDLTPGGCKVVVLHAHQICNA
eukprot:1161594-Pelagomonas_calceolata.AAC.7